VALLLLARAARPDSIEAATVDHGLRPEAAAEARMVATLCAELDVPHAILAVAVAEGNLQAQARDARYLALGKWLDERSLAALVTAHHADDQAETLLMRLNRGSGVAGLAGVRERGRVPGTGHTVIRPLLAWRRAELAEVATAAGIRPADDPSNADARFDRVRIRRALAETDWLDIDALAARVRNLADADAALDWAAGREWVENVRREGLGLVYRPTAPRAVALRVLARIVRELGGDEPRGSAIARLFDSLVAGRPVSNGWSLAPAPRRRR
jgi:tRNA(Ile)-lysidine synthase